MDYSELKATAVASFFLEQAGGELEDLKLMKLMYLAEREAVRQRNLGITGDKFYSMKNGPVLSQTLDRLNPQDGQYDDGIWREHISVPSQWKVRLDKPFDYSRTLSRRELSILSQVWSQFGPWSKWELVNHVHGFSEWRNPGSSRLPIAFQDILAGLDLQPEEREARYREHAAMQSTSSGAS